MRPLRIERHVCGCKNRHVMGKFRTLTKRCTALLTVMLLVLMPAVSFAAESTQNPDSRDQPIPLESNEAGEEPSSEGEQSGLAGTLEFDDSVLNDDMTAVLMDADTGEILFERKPDEQIYPASTTKIMTGLLAIELNGGTLDGEITCGPEVNEFSRTSSLLGLKENFTVSIKDLLYGLMLVSGNDAAAALAVHFGGSLEGFIDLMNQKAQELGMTGTLFANPHGLDQRSIGLDHHSTAADMAKLARAAYQNPLLMEIMGTQSYEITTTELNDNIRSSTELHNGNYLLETPVRDPQRSRYAQYRYQPTTGMKTGLLQNVDGHAYYGCLVASASKDGRNLIATIFADTSNYGDNGPALDRWNAAIALFEYGFTGFVDVEVSPFLTTYTTDVMVQGAASNDPEKGNLQVTISPNAQVPATISVERRDAAALADGTLTIDTVPQLNGSVSAPVTAGQEVGTLSYQVNGQEFFTVPLVASRSVYAAGDESVTSQHYGVPDPTGFQWWMWLIIIGAAAGVLVLVYIILQRRRYSGRWIGKHKRSHVRYPRSWNDDIPLSALRTPRNQQRDRGRRFRR